MGATGQPDSDSLLLEMEETVRQLMISKFGRVIDLEALQTLSVNTTLEELRIKKLRKELLNAKEIKMWEVRMSGHVICNTLVVPGWRQEILVSCKWFLQSICAAGAGSVTPTPTVIL